jgi:hypothetical protein
MIWDSVGFEVRSVLEFLAFCQGASQDGRLLNMSGLAFDRRSHAASIRVRAKPRAPKSRLLGLPGDILEIAVRAAPVDGAANAQLIRTLASALQATGRVG